jgi:tRNA 2-(methylsulfanyl)-N6-isopentenyladenosine37 hydroxylase
MLHLQSTSGERWLSQVEQSLEEILIDHAHCEQKAAATAMSLLGTYIEHDELCREMTIIVQEELEHFHLVVAILRKRGIEFRKQAPGNYGSALNALIRPNDPDRAVDRLLVAGIIEARSCERFDLLRKNIPDAELADFYGSLFESEARHHSTYVRLAMTFQDESTVRLRLQELATAEAKIIDHGNSRPRMHS